MTTAAERFAELASIKSGLLVVDAHDESIVYAMQLSSDKDGALKDSSRAPYLLLTTETGEGVTVVSLHPQAAMKLLSAGSNDQFKLVERKADVAEVKADVVVTTPTTPEGEATKPEVKAESTTKSGKDLVVDFYYAKQAELEKVAGGLAKTKGRCPLRSAVMSYMTDTLGWSPAKSSTYFQNVKSGKWTPSK